MKYLVQIGDESHEVVLNGDGVEVDGTPVAARLIEIDGAPERMVMIGDAAHRVTVRRGAGKGSYTLWVDGFRFDAEALDERSRAVRELSKLSAAPPGPAPLVAPMPGLIVRVQVQVGDHVQPGQGLIVMEAMKMENELRARTAATVKRVLVAPGTAVEKGAVLLELE